MNTPLDDEWRTPTWVPQRVESTVGAMRVDVHWLHTTWMELAFSQEFRTDHSVVELRKPETTLGEMGYWLWAVLGMFVLAVVYPFFILGIATRFYSRRIDRLTAGLGFVGVTVLSVVVWGTLTTVTYLLPFAFEGFVAVAIAGIVATVSAVLALYFTRRDGRASTVVLGYPFGVTALFLPPVVASLYSPTLASIVFPSSTSLAIWLLNNVLSFGGIARFIRASFELEGLAYVGMWFVLAVPTGWILGTLVTVVNGVRQSGASKFPEDTGSRMH